MSLVTLADQYRVFAACKHIFSGSKSRFRKMKKVQAEVERSEHQASFQGLVKDYGIDKIVSMAHSLLIKGIFESDFKAQIMFSELHCTSDAPNLIPVDSRGPPISNGIIALDHARSDHINHQKQHVNRTHNSSSIRKSTKRELGSQSESTSLRSTDLPFRTQHIILSSVQRLLEDCCFEFAMRWAPQVLAKNQWDCAEAVELHKITAVLIDICRQLPDGAILPSFSVSLKQILHSADDIRHSAVHRIRQTAQAVEKMIDIACQLAEALQDEQRLRILQNLHQAILQTLLQRNIEKNNVRQAFNKEREDIKRLRHQLDRREDAALALMISQDEKDSLSTALVLETAAKKIFASAAVIPEPADPNQISNIGNSSENPCKMTLSKNYNSESTAFLREDNRLEAEGDVSNSRVLQDDIGDDDINEHEWDSVMAAVGLSQPQNKVCVSPKVLRTTHACAPNLLGMSTIHDNNEGQHSAREERGDIAQNPNVSSHTSLLADANSHRYHMVCTGDNNDAIPASQPAEDICVEMSEKPTFGDKVHDCFGRRVACDDLEENEDLMRCKRRRL